MLNNFSDQSLKGSSSERARRDSKAIGKHKRVAIGMNHGNPLPGFFFSLYKVRYKLKYVLYLCFYRTFIFNQAVGDPESSGITVQVK